MAIVAPMTARDQVIVVRLTADEKRLIEKAAAAKRLGASTWIRAEVLELAERIIARKDR
jgi:uncharacterized protein (DUF1778 family)